MIFLLKDQLKWNLYQRQFSFLTILLNSNMGQWYVVFNGTKPGIYTSWAECSKYVVGVEGVVHRKYIDYDLVVSHFSAYSQPNPLHMWLLVTGSMQLPLS